MNPLVSLILPAYNEASRIASTLESAVTYFDSRDIPLELIVSADGSDGTRDLARSFRVQGTRVLVIGSDERRGKGRGIRAAVAIATGGIIGFADADNKTPFDEFDKFAPLLRSGVDIVIGSRGLPDSTVERAQRLYRRLGAQAFGVLMHRVVGLDDIIDTQCGFKFFQRDIALDLFTRQRIDGYMFDVEVLYLARRAGYLIAQVPVRWSDDADSRLDLAGGIQNMVDLLRIGRLRKRSSTRERSISQSYL